MSNCRQIIVKHPASIKPTLCVCSPHQECRAQAAVTKPTRLTYSWGKPSRKFGKDAAPLKSPTQRPLCFEGASSDAGAHPSACMHALPATQKAMLSLAESRVPCRGSWSASRVMTQVTGTRPVVSHARRPVARSTDDTKEWH